MYHIKSSNGSIIAEHAGSDDDLSDPHQCGMMWVSKAIRRMASTAMSLWPFMIFPFSKGPRNHIRACNFTPLYGTMVSAQKPFLFPVHVTTSVDEDPICITLQ